MLFRKLSVAWLWFFVLLTSYYVLKPVRDGTSSSLAKQLEPWYLATFIFTVLAMTIYARLYARLTTAQLVFTIYQFFAVCCLAFSWLYHTYPNDPKWLVGSFFIWVGVFNVCAVAMFWSIVTDLFQKNEAKAWFGVLAGAGSVGALVGSYFTLNWASTLGHAALLRATFFLVEFACLLAYTFIWLSQKNHRESEANTSASLPTTNLPMTGDLNEENQQATKPLSAWGSISHILRNSYLMSICVFVLFGKFVATFIYNNLQLEMKDQVESSDQRTELFAEMNLVTQIGSAVFQYLLVGFLMSRLGLKSVLLIPAGVMVIIFGSLYVDPSLQVLIAAQVIQQILGYGVLSPSQNVLFTVVSREDKYVAKGFIDTVIFRLSDTLSSAICSLLRLSTSDLSLMSLAVLPVVAAWCYVSFRLGDRFQQLDKSISVG